MKLKICLSVKDDDRSGSVLLERLSFFGCLPFEQDLKGRHANYKTKLISILRMCFLFWQCQHQGRETPSPGETPYLCRQRNSLARSTNSIAGGAVEHQELNEMERGHLLSPPSLPNAVQLPHSHLISPTT
jgi:hypothetical protein